MNTNNRIQFAALFLGAMVMVGQVMAHSGAMGVVKERVDAMTTLSDHAKSVGDMLKGNADEFRVRNSSIKTSAGSESAWRQNDEVHT